MKKQFKKKVIAVDAVISAFSNGSLKPEDSHVFVVSTGGDHFEITLKAHDFGEDQKDPKVKFMSFTDEELVNFNSKIKDETKAVAGFRISINDGVLFVVTKMSNGSIQAVNLFDELLDLSGNLRQADSFLRQSIDRAQRYAHDIKRNIATYNHFYGELTEDQKAWMLENTSSYEHEIEVAKISAKTRNGGN